MSPVVGCRRSSFRWSVGRVMRFHCRRGHQTRRTVSRERGGRACAARQVERLQEQLANSRPVPMDVSAAAGVADEVALRCGFGDMMRLSSHLHVHALSSAFAHTSARGHVCVLVFILRVSWHGRHAHFSVPCLTPCVSCSVLCHVSCVLCPMFSVRCSRRLAPPNGFVGVGRALLLVWRRLRPSTPPLHPPPLAASARVQMRPMTQAHTASPRRHRGGEVTRPLYSSSVIVSFAPLRSSLSAACRPRSA